MKVQIRISQTLEEIFDFVTDFDLGEVQWVRCVAHENIANDEIYTVYSVNAKEWRRIFCTAFIDSAQFADEAEARVKEWSGAQELKLIRQPKDDGKPAPYVFELFGVFEV